MYDHASVIYIVVVKELKQCVKCNFSFNINVFYSEITTSHTSTRITPTIDAESTIVLMNSTELGGIVPEDNSATTVSGMYRSGWVVVCSRDGG